MREDGSGLLLQRSANGFGIRDDLFFAYKLSDNLSGYMAFVRSLMLWGVIPFDEAQVKQIANTMGMRVRKLHPDFRKWGDELTAEKAICMEIGRLFESKHCWYRYGA